MIDYLAFPPQPSPRALKYTTAQSDSGKIVESQMDSLWTGRRITHTFTKIPIILLHALEVATKDRRVENWDGDGAKAIDAITTETAAGFLLQLPAHIPAPEITADTDGEISFEWYKERYRTFLISMGANRKISYSGLIGSEKWFGVVTFADGIPESIIQGIERVLG